MSLIIDALKRAQQLRVNGTERPPILNYPYPKKGGKGPKKQWIPVSAGLIGLCIVLFVFMKPSPSPLATQTSRAIVPMERAPILAGRPSSVPIAEKISSESPDEAPSRVKDEESLPIRSFAEGYAGQAGQASPPAKRGIGSGERKEKKSAETKKAFVPSPPPAFQKVDSSLKSFGVEQEGGKEGSLALDVIHYFNSGVTFYNQKQFSKAIQAYQKVIELDPTYVEAYNNLGIIYQMTGDVDRAFGTYQKATEINPKYEKGYNNLGILLLVNGRYEEAQDAFQKALAINPNNIESHINLGILFKKKGQWDRAIESYQKALAIDPLHREVHYNIALLYEQLANLELAISHYQQFIQLSSKSHSELVSRVRRHLSDIMKVKK
jgi:tetratricopeptide (TPR) repeat protein